MTSGCGQVRLVVFDLDDTLYPELDYVYSGFAAVAAAIKDELRTEADLAGRMKAIFDSGNRSRVFDALLAEFDRPAETALIRRMVELYRSHRPRISLFGDADLALRLLGGRYHLALLSDGYLISQQRKIEALQLASRIDRIVLTDELGREYWKPDPRPFAMLESAFGLPGALCAYVGDNPSKDFVAPNRLGWQTIMVRRPEALYAHLPAAEQGQPACQIESLDHLADALAPGGIDP